MLGFGQQCSYSNPVETRDHYEKPTAEKELI
jgi:hypothetical protein